MWKERVMKETFTFKTRKKETKKETNKQRKKEIDQNKMRKRARSSPDQEVSVAVSSGRSHWLREEAVQAPPLELPFYPSNSASPSAQATSNDGVDFLKLEFRIEHNNDDA